MLHFNRVSKTLLVCCSTSLWSYRTNWAKLT